MHASDSEVADSGCKVESILFLNDPSHELEQLRKYPVVARVSNTTTVIHHQLLQKLFSQVGFILTPRRNKLSDESFETLLSVHSDNIADFL